MEPFVYRLPLKKFDVGLLPVNARHVGSDEFKNAVTLYFSAQHAAKGETALVTVDDDEIMVVTLKAGQHPFQFVMTMLQSGRIKEAIPLLESLDRETPGDIDILYNLGIAYSELGQYDEAIIRLKQAVQANPQHVHSWVGIGVAYLRLRQPAQAAEALRKAVELNPQDGYAQRNLGAILCGEGAFMEALPHLRIAHEQLPDDPQSIYGYAQVLEQLGGDDQLGQADELYREVIQRFSTAPIAELARTARTRIGQENMRARALGGIRPDVVMYIGGALKTFKEQGPERRQAIVFEIAMLGRQGLNINNPEQKYTLKALPGKFSGLHLLAIMYAGLRQIDPTVDAGVDFSKEYAMAESLQSGS